MNLALLPVSNATRVPKLLLVLVTCTVQNLSELKRMAYVSFLDVSLDVLVDEIKFSWNLKYTFVRFAEVAAHRSCCGWEWLPRLQAAPFRIFLPILKRGNVRCTDWKFHLHAMQTPLKVYMYIYMYIITKTNFILRHCVSLINRGRLFCDPFLFLSNVLTKPARGRRTIEDVWARSPHCSWP